MSKSITVDLDWFNIITAYAEEHCMTKKDTLSMLLGITIGRKNTFFDWYLNDDGYAVAFEGVLAEFFVSDGNLSKLLNGIGSAFLSKNFPICAIR